MEEIKIGNTKIVFHDDFCVKTDEEINLILERIAENAQLELSKIVS